jgi:hypothetical protein
VRLARKLAAFAQPLAALARAQSPGVARGAVGAVVVVAGSAAVQPTMHEEAVAVRRVVAAVPAGEVCAEVVPAGAVVVPTGAEGPAAVRRVVGGTAGVEPAAAGVGSATAGAGAVAVRARRGAAAVQAVVAAVEGVGRSAAARVGDRRE